MIVLQTARGDELGSVVVDAGLLPASSPESSGGGARWVGGVFAAPVHLNFDETYSLVLSTSGGTEYTVLPIREGTDVGLLSYQFTDGVGERSLDGGLTWQFLYPWSPVDVQFYLGAAASTPGGP
jgi:hypothetical protein